MKRKQLRLIIGGALIIGIAAWIFGSVSSENLTYYFKPSEVHADFDQMKDKTIRLMGVVETGSVDWQPRDTRLNFRLTDDDIHFIAVSYNGAKPDMFREGQGIVVEGNLQSRDRFTADVLLVKHSEEYNVDKHKKDKKDYYQSLD